MIGRVEDDNDLKLTKQERENINNLGGDPYYPGNILAYRQIIAAVRAESEELVAAAVRKGYKAGWESAMYQAHVEYGADEDAPVRKLSDRDIAALVEGVKG